MYNNSDELKGYLYFSRNIRFYIELSSFDLVLERYNEETSAWVEFK